MRVFYHSDYTLLIPYLDIVREPPIIYVLVALLLHELPCIHRVSYMDRWAQPGGHLAQHAPLLDHAAQGHLRPASVLSAAGAAHWQGRLVLRVCALSAARAAPPQRFQDTRGRRTAASSSGVPWQPASGAQTRAGKARRARQGGRTSFARARGDSSSLLPSSAAAALRQGRRADSLVTGRFT